MKAKVFSRDDVLNLVCEMANRFREERKDNQEDMFLKGVIVALESTYGKEKLGVKTFAAILIRERVRRGNNRTWQDI